MEKVFEKEWELMCIIRPPWTLEDVLKCTLKHWIAAVSEGFLRKTEKMIKDVDLCLKCKPVGGRKLQDVKFFLDKCNDIAQTLNTSNYSELKTRILSEFEVSIPTISKKKKKKIDNNNVKLCNHKKF